MILRFDKFLNRCGNKVTGEIGYMNVLKKLLSLIFSECCNGTAAHLFRNGYLRRFLRRKDQGFSVKLSNGA